MHKLAPGHGATLYADIAFDVGMDTISSLTLSYSFLSLLLSLSLVHTCSFLGLLAAWTQLLVPGEVRTLVHSCVLLSLDREGRVQVPCMNQGGEGDFHMKAQIATPICLFPTSREDKNRFHEIVLGPALAEICALMVLCLFS